MKLLEMRHRKNPRRHNLDEIIHSIKRNGFKAPPMIDSASRIMVAGHGRCLALERMKLGGSVVPEGIGMDGDGDWLIPALFAPFKSDGDRDAYLIADNRLTELGEYDEKELAALLASLVDTDGGLIGSGFGLDDLAELVAEGEELLDDLDDDEKEVDVSGHTRVIGGHKVRPPAQMTNDDWTLTNVDCLEGLRRLEDNSIDALVTDPPAGISFMGRDWDGDKGGRDQWIQWLRAVMTECHRVLKPGGHGLVWALPRTSHWTAMALEFAGFEIRDRVSHLFLSGFPKSLRLDRDPRFCQCADAEHSGDRIAPSRRQRVRTDMEAAENGDGPLRVDVRHSTNTRLNSMGDYPPADDSGDGRSHSAGDDGRASFPSQECAQEHSRSSEHDDVPASGSTGSPSQALYRTRRANTDSPGPFGSSTSSRQHTHASTSSSEPSEGLDRSDSEDVFPSADRSDALPRCPVCGKPDAHGIGTALKPALEDWWLVRKPLEGTVAANVLKWGTGGINIDACRIPTDDDTRRPSSGLHDGATGETFQIRPRTVEEKQQPDGRWPAHLAASPGIEINDLELPAMYFYCPKPSKAETEAGLGNMPISSPGELTGGRAEGSAGLDNPRAGAGRSSGRANIHPTKKPIALMRWLVRLIAPPERRTIDGEVAEVVSVVLDPFAGSGTTGMAALVEGCKFIGFEREAAYHAIASERMRSIIEDPRLADEVEDVEADGELEDEDDDA